MNRILVMFKERGFVPLNDAPYRFVTRTPRRIGDDAIIVSGGRRVKVTLLKSHGHVRNARYLVAS